MKDLTSFHPGRPYYAVGEPALIEVPAGGQSDWLLVAPRGQVTRFELEKRTEDGLAGKESRELLLTFQEAGYSSLRPPEAESAAGRWFAANLDRTESELEQGDVSVVEGQLRPLQEGGAATAGLGSEVAPRSFWWLLLYASLLLVLSEGVLANRLRIRGMAQ